jgi:hypothetical protein
MVRDAIKNRYCLEILYQRKNIAETSKISYILVEPHILGIFATTNKTLLYAYVLPSQIQKFYGQKEQFKSYNISKIIGLRKKYIHFKPRDKYNDNDTRFSSIISKIKK